MIEEIQAILEVLEESRWQYTDFLVLKIIQVYGTRKKQGLDIDLFLVALESTKNRFEEFERFESIDYIKYLQGAIRNILNDKELEDV